MQRKNNRSKKKLIDGRKLKIAMVVSRFNEDITSGMMEGAMAVLRENAVPEKNVEVVFVPGAFEVPLACQKLASSKKYDALIALGCVIKGETDHYYYISQETTRGIMNVMLELSLPIGFGVITVNNLKQAQERAGKKNNKGVEAAEATLQMINLI